ncbi:MAG: hypothetical protein ACLR9I_01065 [Eisenbergiella sp.]
MDWKFANVKGCEVSQDGGTSFTEIRMGYGCRMSVYQFYNMVAEQEQNI